MLRKSREADSGIKLKVNEKILDSCTTLMQAIRILIQKSRFLQAEIVAQGKVRAILILKNYIYRALLCSKYYSLFVLLGYSRCKRIL